MMRKLFWEIFTLALGIVFIFSLAPLVIAQESDEFTLEEITVTAQKREENQQKVPIAMEVVSGDDIREQGMSDLQEILGSISSVIINTSGEGMKVTIRSISDDKSESTSTSDLTMGTPMVGVNVDGVFSNRMNSGMGFYDLERVEVLFGPQSTLYATTSPGGMVNVVTADPKTDRYEASGLLEYGNYSKLRTEGAMNAPLSDTIAMRAAFSTVVRDGYLTNGASDDDSKSARLKALFQPNDRFSFIIAGEYQKAGGQGYTSVEPFVNQDDTDNPWTSASAEALPTPNREKTKIYANINWDIGFGDLTIVPALTDINNMDTTREESSIVGEPMVTTVSDDTGYEKGVEVRLASSADSPVRWILGFNWYDSEYKKKSVSDNGEWGWQSRWQGIKAVYGNITYPVTDQFRVTGGIRYSKDENDSQSQAYPARGNMSIDPVTRVGWEIVEMSYSDPDYKIGIEYDLGENNMIYTDYSTSYRTQKGADAFKNPFPPEFLKAFTIGSKNRFLENKLQLNASGFYYRYDNYMTMGNVRSIFQKDINGDGDYDDTALWDEDYKDYRDEYIVGIMDENGRTIGDAWVAGLDVQTSWIITNKDKVDISVSYLKTEFINLFQDFWDTTNEMGVPDQDYSGKGMTNSPEWTINANYSHNFQLLNKGIITARIDARYVSEYFLGWNDKNLRFDMNWNPVITDMSEERKQEAYHMTDLSATYNSPDGQWSLAGYVRNLENYAVKTFFMSMPGIQMSIGAPRTYGAVLTVKY